MLSNSTSQVKVTASINIAGGKKIVSETVLMVEFYQQLEKNPDKARALRQAMLKTKEKHPGAAKVVTRN